MDSDHSCFERVILTWTGMLVYSIPKIIVPAKLSTIALPDEVRSERLNLRLALQQEPHPAEPWPPYLQIAPFTTGKQPGVANGPTSTKKGSVTHSTIASPMGLGTAQSSR